MSQMLILKNRSMIKKSRNFRGSLWIMRGRGLRCRPSYTISILSAPQSCRSMSLISLLSAIRLRKMSNKFRISLHQWLLSVRNKLSLCFNVRPFFRKTLSKLRSKSLRITYMPRSETVIRWLMIPNSKLERSRIKLKRLIMLLNKDSR